MKKVIIRIILVIFFLLVIGGIGYFIYYKVQENNYKKHVEEVKNVFSTYAVIQKDTNLHQYVNGQFKENGKIYADTYVELSNIKDDYYQILDTQYYLYYRDVSSSSKQEMGYAISPYLLFNENIQTNNPVDIYQNEKKILTLNQSLTASVWKKGEVFDTVLINNQPYQIIKEQIVNREESQNDIQTSLEKISIFYFSDTKNIEEKIKYLHENNYIFIKEEDLKQFLSGNIRLPEKTTMLIFKEKTEEIEKFISTYSLTVNYEENLTLSYKVGDAQASKLTELYRYSVTSSTTLSRFKDMLQGKKEVVKVTPSVQSIAVLNYHFFYDKNTQVCSESICLDRSNFEEQLKYLKDNGFKTLTMQEFNDWLDKKVELPKKSVLITVDDGAMGTDTLLPELLEKYDLKGTLFLISGWWPMSKYRVGNLEIQAHGHDLHHNDFCNNGKCGYKGLLLSKEEIKADLQLAKQTIGNPIAFCYPFYAYNNTLVSAVQEEFSLAFVGGNKKASRNVNKYKIPRYIIYKNTSLESFKKMVNP